ncbi:MAG: hypothetical protein FJW20_06300 [Acidimicrobiia bacterium]|nr:hypothetical protein [Acidimicrobiia bacterium]
MSTRSPASRPPTAQAFASSPTTPAFLSKSKSSPAAPTAPNSPFKKPARSSASTSTPPQPAIVTCGGLCPGLHNVIRSIVMQLYHGFGVQDVVGIRYGYKGLDPASGIHPIPLRPQHVADIH